MRLAERFAGVARLLWPRVTMADAEAKRAANIAAKEAERGAKNEAIKAEKQKKAAERAGERSAKEKAEEAKLAAQAETAAKREAAIAAKEEARKAKADDVKGKKKEQGSKYSKKDVFELKKVFDEYDRDRSGKVSLDEFTKKLADRKNKAMVRPGEKSSLEQRKAQEGVSISDLSEGAFREMDKDGDGEVEFEELLRLMFRFATDKEIKTMLEWVAPAPEPEPEPKAELSKEARDQINSIFKLYDKDKSGALTMNELKKALEKTGIDPDEIKGYFKDYDKDGNNEIDKTEFLALMESTGAFDDL